jgi:hypothetical protein
LPQLRVHARAQRRGAAAACGALRSQGGLLRLGAACARARRGAARGFSDDEGGGEGRTRAAAATSARRVRCAAARRLRRGLRAGARARTRPSCGRRTKGAHARARAVQGRRRLVTGCGVVLTSARGLRLSGQRRFGRATPPPRQRLRLRRARTPRQRRAPTRRPRTQLRARGAATLGGAGGAAPHAR